MPRTLPLRLRRPRQLLAAAGHGWLALWVIVILGACAPVAAPAPAVERLNLAAAAGLGEATAVDVLEFTPAGAERYTLRATVTDAGELGPIVAYLNQENRVGPAPACVALYRLRFQYSDGTVRTFDLACDETTALLFGDDPLLRGRSVSFDAALIQLLNTYLR